MARITSKQAKELKEAYVSVHNLAEETARERFQRRKEEIKNPFGKTTIQTKDGKELKQGDPGFEDALKNARETVRNANNKSLGKDSDTVTSKGGTERTVKKSDDGKGITITKKDLDSETDEMIANTPTIKDRKFGGTATQRPVPQNNNQTAPQARPGRTVGAPSGTGRPGSMVRVQGKPTQPGALSRLGSLAGKAVAGARNVAGNVKQGVQSAAGGIKQGAQAVAGGIRQGAQAVAGALANKGPIQGRQTGTQRRAQQQAARPQPTAQPVARPQPTAQPVAKPVQAAPVAKPVPQAQPVAKPAPRLSGAQRAQQMAKDRIAAGRNTVTGELKSKPKVRKVTSPMDMEGYDPMENLFDDTVKFLVSEGHAKDASEAMSIMSESEFIDAFKEELNG